MLIALTGGIASGKSTVAEIWRGYGAEIVDADQIARDVVIPGSIGLQRVVERFGAGVLTAAGTLNRAALGEIVFANAEAKRDLEAILHPLIKEQSVARFAASKAKHVVYAIPLLAEAGGDYSFDKVCAISAPIELRVERLVQFRNMSRSEAIRRVQSQVSDTEREALADVVIDSNCSLDVLRGRAALAWEALTGDGGESGGA